MSISMILHIIIINMKQVNFPWVFTLICQLLVHLAGRRGSRQLWPSRRAPGWWVWGRSGSPSGWRPWSEERPPGFPSPGTSSSCARRSPPRWGSCPLRSLPVMFDVQTLKHTTNFEVKLNNLFKSGDFFYNVLNIIKLTKFSKRYSGKSKINQLVKNKYFFLFLVISRKWFQLS